MRFSLLPKGDIFYRLLERLTSKSEEAVGAFKVLVLEWHITHPHLQLIRDLEHECDQIVHEIMIKLNKTFITPIDREEIHQLTKKIDDLVDHVNDLSQRMFLFRIVEIKTYLKEMVDLFQQAAHSVHLAIHKMRGFKEISALFPLCINIHDLENKGDALYEKALGELFQNETNAIEIIKWKEIYDFIEFAIDKCEDIADILWGIAVKYG